MSVQEEREAPESVELLPRDDDGMLLAVLDQCPEGGFFEIDQWLPALEQMQDALRLNVEDAVHGDPIRRAALGPCPATSMRHGTGMIFAVALLAGFLPFLIGWIQAARFGTVVPFVNWARFLNLQDPFPSSDAALPVLGSTLQSIAGLEPWLPIWLAAALSALGQWLSWPLQWLGLWIVYGIGVLAISHLLGARATLQHFYAGTSYACLPFLLLALTPLPLLGGLAALAALIWGAILYVKAVMAVTGMDVGRSIISVVTPGAIMGLLTLLGIAGALLSTLRMVAF